MTQLLHVSPGFPAVILTVMVGLSLVSWVFVISGALAVDSGVDVDVGAGVDVDTGVDTAVDVDVDAGVADGARGAGRVSVLVRPWPAMGLGPVPLPISSRVVSRLCRGSPGRRSQGQKTVLSTVEDAGPVGSG